MNTWLASYISDNYHDLLDLDIKWARLMGAPKHYTLSGYAYKLEQQGKLWGKINRVWIDKLFYWIRSDVQHCMVAYQQDLLRITQNAQGTK